MLVKFQCEYKTSKTKAFNELVQERLDKIYCEWRVNELYHFYKKRQMENNGVIEETPPLPEHQKTWQERVKSYDEKYWQPIKPENVYARATQTQDNIILEVLGSYFEKTKQLEKGKPLADYKERTKIEEDLEFKLHVLGLKPDATSLFLRMVTEYAPECHVPQMFLENEEHHERRNRSTQMWNKFLSVTSSRYWVYTYQLEEYEEKLTIILTVTFGPLLVELIRTNGWADYYSIEADLQDLCKHLKIPFRLVMGHIYRMYHPYDGEGKTMRSNTFSAILLHQEHEDELPLVQMVGLKERSMPVFPNDVMSGIPQEIGNELTAFLEEIWDNTQPRHHYFWDMVHRYGNGIAGNTIRKDYHSLRILRARLELQCSRLDIPPRMVQVMILWLYRDFHRPLKVLRGPSPAQVIYLTPEEAYGTSEDAAALIQRPPVWHGPISIRLPPIRKYALDRENTALGKSLIDLFCEEYAGLLPFTGVPLRHCGKCTFGYAYYGRVPSNFPHRECQARIRFKWRFPNIPKADHCEIPWLRRLIHYGCTREMPYYRTLRGRMVSTETPIERTLRASTSDSRWEYDSPEENVTLEDLCAYHKAWKKQEAAKDCLTKWENAAGTESCDSSLSTDTWDPEIPQTSSDEEEDEEGRPSEGVMELKRKENQEEGTQSDDEEYQERPNGTNLSGTSVVFKAVFPYHWTYLHED
jgi:hypothetical protein